MLDVYQPTQLLLALWPTADFELPADGTEFGQRLCEQFPIFQTVQTLLIQGAMAPPELPRLVLSGHFGNWGLDLAPGRISLQRKPDGPVALPEMLEEFRSTILPLHTWLAEQANLRVYRVGFVTDLFCNTKSSASAKIAQYFLQPRSIRGALPNEVNLALHNRLVIGDAEQGIVMANRWLRIQPMRTRDLRRLDFAAQVQVDLNTMAEDTQVKTGRDLGTFLEAAFHHLQHDIPLLDDTDFLA